MKRQFALAAALFACLHSAFADEAPDDRFIRVVETEKSARLQTSVTSYEKEGVKLDLIGAIHIADQSYYEKLNEIFKGYDIVLFEMIGGEGLGRQAAEAAKPEIAGAPAPEEEGEADPVVERRNLTLGLIYQEVADFLKLTSQVDIVDYTAQNFIHADLTAGEFSEKQEERGESLLTFLLSADKANPTPPNPLKLIYGILTRRSDIVKLAVIHTLGDAEDQVNALAGDSVVITDRNARCLEVLDRELAAGEKKIGIFYGAAHFPDLETGLIERGFAKAGARWLTAWNVPKPKRAKAASAE